MLKTGTRPATPWEISKRAQDPTWLLRHGLRHEPAFGKNVGKAATKVHRQYRVLQGGYQGPRKHRRKLIVAWERASLCIQCKRPIQTTVVKTVYKGQVGLVHKFHRGQ